MEMGPYSSSLLNVATLMDAIEGIAYAVDRDGVIIACSHNRWEGFALANDGAELADPSSVIGRPLLDFIAGDDIKAHYARVLETVLGGEGGAVAFSYRCDGATVQREGRLSVTPILGAAGIAGALFQSVMLHESARPAMPLFDFKARARDLEKARSLPLVEICSYCASVNKPHDAAEENWVSAEAYYAQGGISEVSISHSICPPCFDRLMPGNGA